jgi:hypothetical protein
MKENYMITQTTNQQVINYIQRKIAETHAIGEDINTLLDNPEVVFCLQVLDGVSSNLLQPLANVHEENTLQENMQPPLKAGANSYNESNRI